MRSCSRITVQVSKRLSLNARLRAPQRNNAARASGVSPPQCRCAKVMAELAAISPCGSLIRSWMYFTISSGGTCRFKKCAVSVIAPILSRILETEHGILIVVGKGLRVSAPAHRRAQALFRGLLAHEVLQFVDKAAFPRRMRRALVQYTAYMGRQRHIIEQMAQ